MLCLSAAVCWSITSQNYTQRDEAVEIYAQASKASMTLLADWYELDRMAAGKDMEGVRGREGRNGTAEPGGDGEDVWR